MASDLILTTQQAPIRGLFNVNLTLISVKYQRLWPSGCPALQR